MQLSPAKRDYQGFTPISVPDMFPVFLECIKTQLFIKLIESSAEILILDLAARQLKVLSFLAPPCQGTDGVEIAMFYVLSTRENIHRFSMIILKHCHIQVRQDINISNSYEKIFIVQLVGCACKK